MAFGLIPILHGDFPCNWAEREGHEQNEYSRRLEDERERPPPATNNPSGFPLESTGPNGNRFAFSLLEDVDRAGRDHEREHEARYRLD